PVRTHQTRVRVEMAPTVRGGGRMDATELLSEDHREVEQLFEKFEQATGDTEQKAALAQEIIKELSIHASIEEEVFYPEVKAAVSDGEGLVYHSLEEHQEVKELLAELERMGAGDPGFHQKME